MNYQQRKAAARQQAIDWQQNYIDHPYSYESLSIAIEYFNNLGKRFGLLREFRENAIL